MKNSVDFWWQIFFHICPRKTALNLSLPKLPKFSPHLPRQGKKFITWSSLWGRLHVTVPIPFWWRWCRRWRCRCWCPCRWCACPILVPTVVEAGGMDMDVDVGEATAGEGRECWAALLCTSDSSWKDTKEYLNQRGTKIRVFRVCFRAPFLPPFFPHSSPLFPLKALSPLLPHFSLHLPLYPPPFSTLGKLWFRYPHDLGAHFSVLRSLGGSCSCQCCAGSLPGCIRCKALWCTCHSNGEALWKCCC